MNIGNAIRICRAKRNITQADLAKSVGISPSYLSMLEQGKRHPNLEMLESIANALGIPLSILIFLAADNTDIKEISPEVYEKLSALTLELIRKLDNR